jgi:hypothetical protein
MSQSQDLPGSVEAQPPTLSTASQPQDFPKDFIIETCIPIYANLTKAKNSNSAKPSIVSYANRIVSQSIIESTNTVARALCIFNRCKVVEMYE